MQKLKTIQTFLNTVKTSRSGKRFATVKKWSLRFMIILKSSTVLIINKVSKPLIISGKIISS